MLARSFGHSPRKDKDGEDSPINHSDSSKLGLSEGRLTIKTETHIE